MSKDYYEILQGKYPDGYFEHFITMFQSAANEDGYKEHAKNYVDIEGMEAFEKLIEEIQNIEKNKDWELFVELVRAFEIECLDDSKIKELAVIAIEMFRELSR